MEEAVQPEWAPLIEASETVNIPPTWWIGIDDPSLNTRLRFLEYTLGYDRARRSAENILKQPNGDKAHLFLSGKVMKRASKPNG